MSRVEKLRQFLIRNLSLSDEKSWNPSLWNLIGSQSLSGEQVTEHTALTYSAIWDAVGQIAGTISTLPLHLHRKEARKTLYATDKRLFNVLHSKFNPYMTAQIGREVMTAHVLLWGNSYAEIVRDGLGEVRELWPIAPNRVRVEMKDGALIYKIMVGSENIILPRSRVLHIPGLGFDGFMGYSVISMARKNIGLSMAMETFSSLYYGQGTHPGVIVSHPGKLNAESHSNLKKSLTDVYSGLGNSHRLMLLEDGMDIKSLGIPPADSQYIESRQFGITDVARWFHIPPHRLKDLTRATMNNIEYEQLSYGIDTILPWLVRFEQNFDMQLLSEVQQFQQFYYTRHNMDGILRGSSKDRAEYYKIMVSIGAMTLNDVRGKENWDPYDHPYADEPFIAINNMIPISKIDDYLKNKPGQQEGEDNDNKQEILSKDAGKSG